MRLKLLIAGLLLTSALGVTPIAAENQSDEKRGAVTKLPIPRFVSLKARKGNIRRGPSQRHKIDWVLQKRGIPLKVIGEHGHWRMVRDRDGVGGWIHYALLSGHRTVIITQDMVPLLSQAREDSHVTAHLQSGVIASIDTCGPYWCKLSVQSYEGWVPKPAFWGVEKEELID